MTSIIGAEMFAAIDRDTRYFAQLREVQDQADRLNRARNTTPPLDPIDRTWKLRDDEQNARNAERAILWRVKLRFIR